MLYSSQVIVLSILLIASTVSGQTLSDSLLSVRAVDVGSGNCSIVELPNHRYGHPYRSVKDRYLQHGVPIENIFRTDLKDTESNPHDWEDERYSGCKGLPGDYDIAITITNQGIS